MPTDTKFPTTDENTNPNQPQKVWWATLIPAPDNQGLESINWENVNFWETQKEVVTTDEQPLVKVAEDTSKTELTNDFDLWFDSPDSGTQPNSDIEEKLEESIEKPIEWNNITLENLDLWSTQEEVKEEPSNTTVPEVEVKNDESNAELFSSNADTNETENISAWLNIPEIVKDDIPFWSAEESWEENIQTEPNIVSNEEITETAPTQTEDLVSEQEISKKLTTDDAVNQILPEDDSPKEENLDDITEVIEENAVQSNNDSTPEDTTNKTSEFQPTSMSSNMNLDQMVEKFNNQKTEEQPLENTENSEVINSRAQVEEKKEEPAVDPISWFNNIANNANSDSISLWDMAENISAQETIKSNKSSKGKVGLWIVLLVLILILATVSAYVMYPDLVQNILGNNKNIQEQTASQNTWVLTTWLNMETESSWYIDDLLSGETETGNEMSIIDNSDEEGVLGLTWVIEEVPFLELSYEEKLQQYIKMWWDMWTSWLEIEDTKMIERGNIITKEAAELLSGIQMSWQVDFELLEKYFKKFDYLIQKNNI